MYTKLTATSSMMISSNLFLLALFFRWLLFASAAAAATSSSAAAVAAPLSFDNALHIKDDHHHHPTTPISHFSQANDDQSSVFEVPNLSELKSALYNHLVTATTLQEGGNNDHDNHVHHRKLTTFTAFNNLLSQVRLNLPDAAISTNGLDLTISQLTCSNLSIQTININHTPLSNTDQRVTIGLSGVQIKCNFRWGYKWTILSGQGNGEAILDEASGATIQLHFMSDDYTTRPPHNVRAGHCTSNIQILDMSFQGDGWGGIGQIIDWIEHLLRDMIEGELNGVVCSELGGLADEALDQVLLDLSEMIDVYLVDDVESSSSNGGGDGGGQLLSLENALQQEEKVPTDDNGDSLYLNFQDMGEYTGEWINSAIDQIDTLFGATDSFGGLAINKLIRENLLNEQGLFQLDPSVFLPSSGGGGGGGANIMDTHDMFTETTMSMKSIKLAGLDSFVEMDVLNPIGKHTLGNSLKLQYLWVEIEMEAVMKASSLSDAIIVAPNSPTVTERFKIDFTLTDLALDFSFLLGINTETLGTLQLGSLLDTNNILSCLLSTVEAFAFSELKLRVSDVIPPKLNDFLDEGIDYIITQLADAMFDMYEAVLKEALPNFFNSFVRDMANDYLEETLIKFVGACPENNDMALERHLDWRDMLMLPSEASLAGASGTSPYGDVIPWVMDIVESQLFTADNDGLLALNNMVIRPLSKSQSGTEGLIHLNGTLVDLHKVDVKQDIWRAFAQNLRLKLSDLRVAGIDTLREPFQVLNPRSSSAHMLENKLSFGTDDQAVDASVQLELVVGGNQSPLATNNVMDLHIGVPSIEILAVLFATVSESRFMQMPLRDVLNFHCWLSMIPQSALNIGASIPVLDILMNGGMLPKTSCVSCTNGMLKDLNTIIDFLSANGFIDTIQSRGLSILTELVQSDFMQGTIDGQLYKSASQCPHDPNFGSTVMLASTPFRATRDLVDSIVYASIGMVQTIAIVFAQKHTSVAPPANITLDVPDDAQLIDLTDLSSVASWADMALAEGKNYLGGVVESESDDRVLGISSLLSSTLGDNGLMTFPLADQNHGFEAGGVKLLLVDVSLVGLDSFEVFDVLNTTDPNTFSNKIKLETIGVILRMELSAGDSKEPEMVTVTLTMKDVEIDAGLGVAMDQDLLGSLRLGSILNTSQIFFCILSTIHSAGLSEFMMQVGDISEFSISGFISEETDKQIQSITEAIFSNYKKIIVDAIPAFTSTTIRPLLHEILQVLMDMGKGSQCPEPDDLLEGLVDFRDLFLSESRALALLGRGNSPYGDLFRSLYSVLDRIMSASDENGMSEMNSLIATLTERQSSVGGDIHFPGELIGQNVDIALNGLNAKIDISLSDLRVSNIDSLGAPIKLLQPMMNESSALHNHMFIGAGEDALRTSFTLKVNGEGDGVKVNNELELGISLKSMDMMLELLAEIQEYPFLHFPLKDLLNMDCWLATVVTPVLDKYGMRVGEANSGIVLRNLALAVAEARIDLNCIACSSPLLLDMSSFLASKQGIEDTTQVANDVFDYVSNLLGGDFVRSFIDKSLNEAGMKCPHSPTYMKDFNGLQFDDMIASAKSESSYGFLIAIIVVVACLLVLIAVAIALSRFVRKRRHERWLKTLTREQLLDLEKMQIEETKIIKDLDSRMRPLVLSADVPMILRVLIPFVILGNIALFLSGHLSLGGTVNLSGSFGGQFFDVDGFFEFSMVKSTIEMWNAGAKPLAILIVIFSGVWPYTKQLITLVIWFLPTTRVSSNRRGKILNWLDVLGKWSMVDVFVLLMTLASFRLSVESPDHLSFLPEGLYSINMLVVPLWGLYANMLAQLLSQISSHVIIHYHRKTIAAARDIQDEEWGVSRPSDAASSPLRKHSFVLDYEASTERAHVRKGTSWLFATVLVLFVLLVICGCSLPSFSIETFGIVGLAIESGQQFQEAKTSYSVFDLSKMIMDEARYLSGASNYVGLGTLASLLVICVFLVPLAQATSLCVQWFAPTNVEQRRKNFVSNECLAAWQYMEVYVLSIVISAWQLGGVSEFMINAYCDPLNGTLNALSYAGILKQEDAQCFRVDATVEAASWLLVAASILLFLSTHFINSASLQKCQDEDVPTERRFHSDRWPNKSEQQLAVTDTMDITINASMDIDDSEEEGSDASERKIKISPVPSRFTDYFYFATTRKCREACNVEEGDCAFAVQWLWDVDN